MATNPAGGPSEYGAEVPYFGCSYPPSRDGGAALVEALRDPRELVIFKVHVIDLMGFDRVAIITNRRLKTYRLSADLAAQASTAFSRLPGKVPVVGDILEKVAELGGTAWNSLSGKEERLSKLISALDSRYILDEQSWYDSPLSIGQHLLGWSVAAPVMMYRAMSKLDPRCRSVSFAELREHLEEIVLQPRSSGLFGLGKTHNLVFRVRKLSSVGTAWMMDLDFASEDHLKIANSYCAVLKGFLRTLGIEVETDPAQSITRIKLPTP